MSHQMSEMEKREEEIKLKQIAGTPQHIEINERTLIAYREEFAKKGLVIEQHKDYPREDYYLIRKQKKFDSIVDPSKGIRKVIISMVRQPVTIFENFLKVRILFL